MNIYDKVIINSKKYLHTQKGNECVVLAIDEAEKSALVYNKADHGLYTIAIKNLKPVSLIEQTNSKSVEPPKSEQKLDFVVGARVKVINKKISSGSSIKYGMCGTIKKIKDNGVFAVEFDKNISGHSCQDYCKDGHGWWFCEGYKKFFEIIGIEQKRDTNFKVGEWVRIRDWEDMATEYGCDPTNCIMCEEVFAGGMEYLCGMYVKIKSISDKKVLFDIDETKKGLLGSWNFSTDMIEKLPEIKVGDIVKFRTLDDLKNNFDVTDWGDISIGNLSMLKTMRQACGKEYIVTEKMDIENGVKDFRVSDEYFGTFFYNNLMIEKVKEKC